ncbi:MAG TPA: carbohydrate binding domain-containing protein [Candidatus Sulfotelmatobacter sp.]|nr:carbohydrate binding domain-containing protein [Candidatus Sulfotelmatobacter sp.]
MLRKIVFAAACVILIALYIGLSFRAYFASRVAAVPDVPHLEKAIRLEPTNAEYHQLLGRNLALSGVNLDDAIAAFRAAVQLNPYDARSWLDLAGAYQFAGRVQDQADSVQHAVEADPNTPHVAWEAANFFLLQGDQAKALRYFGVVMANDPELLDAALQLCWRVTGDADQIVTQVLAPRPDLYLAFLRLLVSKQDVANAEIVWNHLIALNREFSPSAMFPYFRLLIAKQEVTAAETAWQQAASVNRSLQLYLSSHQNLVVNGGFEENILNGGFDWWYQPNSHAALSIDTSDFSAGTRSLSISFDGMNAPDAGIFQFIPVKPSTEYAFSADYRAEELDTASGPRFSITDPYSKTSYVLTDDILGTNPWRQAQAQFRTGPNAKLVLLRIVRQPADALIRGKLWIDNLKLVEK